MKIKILFIALCVFFSQCICLWATTIDHEEIKCGTCGTVQNVIVLTSTSSSGMQLDTRPGPPEKYTLGLVLQICRKCGVCAFNISKPITQKEALAYVEEIGKNKEKLSDLAFAYHTAAQIELLQNKNYLKSALLELRAAWVCDDSERIFRSNYCRRKAIEYLKQHIKTGKATADHWLILTDMQRRCGLFSDAEESLKKLKEREDLSDNILFFVEKEAIFLRQKNMSTSDIEDLPAEESEKKQRK